MTYELRCRDAGCPSCSGTIEADSEEQLRARAAAHLKDKHGVEAPSETIMDYLVSVSGERKKPLKF